jgi:hypothetical protein
MAGTPGGAGRASMPPSAVPEATHRARGAASSPTWKWPPSSPAGAHPWREERPSAASRAGCSSVVVPEVNGAPVFENIFFKNNDLRMLRCRLQATGRHAGAVGPPKTWTRRVSKQSTARSIGNFRLARRHEPRVDARTAGSEPLRAATALRAPEGRVWKTASDGRPTRWGTSRPSVAVASPHPSTYW